MESLPSGVRASGSYQRYSVVLPMLKRETRVGCDMKRIRVMGVLHGGSILVHVLLSAFRCSLI
jgi:hypothetical protein